MNTNKKNIMLSIFLLLKNRQLANIIKGQITC